MKSVLRLLPSFLCSILMGAHFLRMGGAGQIPMLFCLVFPFVLFFRRSWVRWLMVAALALASVSWIVTALQFVMVRQQMEQPYLRLAFIFGGVLLFHFLAVGLLFGERMRAYFLPQSVASASESPEG